MSALNVRFTVCVWACGPLQVLSAFEQVTQVFRALPAELSSQCLKEILGNWMKPDLTAL